MKKLFLIIASLMMAFAVQAKSSELKIQYNEIPQKAQLFITDHFKDVPVKKATQKFDDGVAEYKVYLKNGAVIEFDMVGAWSEVTVALGKVMPTGFIPDKVKDTLLSRFADKKMYKIENDGYEYEAKFTDGSEVKINALGNIIEYDAD